MQVDFLRFGQPSCMVCNWTARRGLINGYLPMANEEYIGKHLLVGLTYVDHNDEVTRQVQLHGTITRITDEGIFINQANAEEEFSLPPDVESLKPARPGEYRLRSTGEVVV